MPKSYEDKMLMPFADKTRITTTIRLPGFCYGNNDKDSCHWITVRIPRPAKKQPNISTREFSRLISSKLLWPDNRALQHTIRMNRQRREGLQRKLGRLNLQPLQNH